MREEVKRLREEKARLEYRVQHLAASVVELSGTPTALMKGYT